MKKVFSKVVSVTLACAMAFSGVSFSHSVSAANAVEQWKEKAVKTPGEGKLIGAGYIDVEFDNSMEGYTYTVYLDGKPMYWNGDDIVRTELGEEKTQSSVIKTFSSQDTPKTEVYTTTVSKHELTVKAVKGSEEVVSNTRTFYVSKKGMALGGDMSKKISMKDLNCSWYYNWATEPFNNELDAFGEVSHAPMMWGGGDDNKESMENLQTTANYILGFNEPDIGSQANMLFFNAIDIWKQYISPLNMRKVSPAPADPNGGSSWLKEFMEGGYKCINPRTGEWGLYKDYKDDETKTFVDGMGDDVDSVVLHYYRNSINLEGLGQAVQNLWNYYHKPIWITEISIMGARSIPSVNYSYDREGAKEEMADYVRGLVELLDATPYVERYCWFSYDIDSTNDIDAWDGSGATSMFEYATGYYTELGKLYSSIGNPKGYNAVNIQDTPDFVWANRIRSDATYDKNTDQVTMTWYTGTLNVASYKVMIDDQEYNVTNGGTIDVSGLSEGKHSYQVEMCDAGGEVLFNKKKAFVIERPEPGTEPTTNRPVEPTTKKTETTTKPAQTTSKVSKPKKFKLSKAQNIKKKSVKLTWKKSVGAKTYQIQYALNSKFTKGLKTKNTKNAKKLTIKITSLKKKKTYYFRVRGKNTAGYGAWSNVKKVKIKK